MNGTTAAVSILTLIAGVGVFLIACGMMSANLEALGGARIKKLFSKTANGKLMCMGLGAAVTAAIQSSSATTVMAIGFVDAGIMSLCQAAAVIFGANIGTTVTGQLVALGMIGQGEITSSVVLAAFTGVGAFLSAFSRKDGVRKAGGMLAGFGMIFVGLDVMSGAMDSFAVSDKIKIFAATFENPILLVFVGLLVTAIVQSSSVMTSVVITMTVSGLINLNQGVYITIGANVGTCVTALLAGAAGGANAKRAALIHVIFNASGACVFLLVGAVMRIFATDYGGVLQAVFGGMPQMQLAVFHTIFNATTVVLILPFTERLAGLVTRLVRDKQSIDIPHGFGV